MPQNLAYNDPDHDTKFYMLWHTIIKAFIFMPYHLPIALDYQSLPQNVPWLQNRCRRRAEEVNRRD